MELVLTEYAKLLLYREFREVLRTRFTDMEPHEFENAIETLLVSIETTMSNMPVTIGEP